MCAAFCQNLRKDSLLNDNNYFLLFKMLFITIYCIKKCFDRGVAKIFTDAPEMHPLKIYQRSKLYTET